MSTFLAVKPSFFFMKSLAFFVALLLLQSCSTQQSNDSSETVEGHIEVGGHSLYTISNKFITTLPITKSSRVVVILDGDGRPWIRGGKVLANDPTPRSHFVRSWVEQLPVASLYLARPCYFKDVENSNCTPDWWSFARYSPDVIRIMTDALNLWLKQHPSVHEVTLVGHSGGGVIALLMAEKIHQVTEVISLSTPVDTNLWARSHNYSPLIGSINPAQQLKWRPDLKRVFYYGSNDDNVEPTLFAPIAQTIANSQVHIVDGQSHKCCGPNLWLKKTIERTSD